MAKELDFTGKNVLVTGGSKNIGKRTVECFLETGANVVFTFHGNEAAAQATYEELKPKAQGHFSYFKADCGDFDSVNATFDYCNEVMGPVDFLVNNAAKLDGGGGNIRVGDTDTTIERSNFDEFHAQMIGTLSSVFYHTNRFVKDCLRDGRPGRIVNLSSKAAVSTKSGILAYAAAKAGVSMFTHVMGQELGRHGIIVTAIQPGFVDDAALTGGNEKFVGHLNAQNMGPIGRVAVGRDMAEMIVVLCGPAGDMAIGSDVDMTGGRLLQ